MFPQPDTTPSPEAGAEYSQEERRLLLKLAHDAIDAALRHQEVDTTPPSDHLAEKRGAFTTLHLHGQLRGCVGYVFAVRPLMRTVAETCHKAGLPGDAWEHGATLEAFTAEVFRDLPRPALQHKTA